MHELTDDEKELLTGQREFNTLLLAMHAAHIVEARRLWRVVIINLILSILLLFSSCALASEFSRVEKKYGIPHNLLKSICSIESGLKYGAYRPYDGTSPSYGRCQIKESTARDMGWTGDDIMDLLYGEAEIYYAGKYLHYQYLRYNKDWISAIAAYNAGSVKIVDGQFFNVSYVRKVLEKCTTLSCRWI